MSDGLLGRINERLQVESVDVLDTIARMEGV